MEEARGSYGTENILGAIQQAQDDNDDEKEDDKHKDNRRRVATFVADGPDTLTGTIRLPEERLTAHQVASGEISLGRSP